MTYLISLRHGKLSTLFILFSLVSFHRHASSVSAVIESRNVASQSHEELRDT